MDQAADGPIPVLPPSLAAVFMDALAFAGTQLGGLVERDIQFQGSHAAYARLEDLLQSYDRGPESPVTAVYVAFSGDIDGHVLLCMTPDTADFLSRMLLMCDDIDTPQMRYLADSVVGELGNVATSAFLNAVADTVKLTVLPAPPCVVHDMWAAVLQSIVVEVAQTQAYGILVETRIVVEGAAMAGTLVLLPSLASCRRMESILSAGSPVSA